MFGHNCQTLVIKEVKFSGFISGTYEMGLG